MTSTLELFTRRLEGTRTTLAALTPLLPQIAGVADRVVRVLKSGGTICTCGNGGSAAQALHLAEELIGRYRADRPPLRAVCLNADPTALTCIANDFGFEHVYSRQCEALLTERDALIAFSTSGRSANIIAALKSAQARQAGCIALLGRDGGACRALCDDGMAIVVPGADSAHVQEAHQVILHLICEAAEAHFARG